MNKIVFKSNTSHLHFYSEQTFGVLKKLYKFKGEKWIKWSNTNNFFLIYIIPSFITRREIHKEEWQMI